MARCPVPSPGRQRRPWNRGGDRRRAPSRFPSGRRPPTGPPRTPHLKNPCDQRFPCGKARPLIPCGSASGNSGPTAGFLDTHHPQLRTNQANNELIPHFPNPRSARKEKWQVIRHSHYGILQRIRKYCATPPSGHYVVLRSTTRMPEAHIRKFLSPISPARTISAHGTTVTEPHRTRSLRGRTARLPSRCPSARAEM